MSTYVKARDIIATVRRFHRQLKVYYARLAEESDKRRVRMMLDYLSGVERRFEEGMANYEADDVDSLLDTWLQYGPDEEQLDPPSVEDLGSDMTVDDVEKMAIQFNNALSEFCAETTGLADTERVRRLFRSLADQQEAEKANIANISSAAARSL